MLSHSTGVAAFLAAVVMAFGGASHSACADEDASIEFFERRIRPVLIEHCYECHSAGAKEVKGGLYLDSAAGLLKGGDSGPAIVTKAPEESLLISSVRYESLEMPPAGRLPDAVIRDLETWVATGAIDPRTEATEHNTRAPEMDMVAARDFWAFRPFHSEAGESATQHRTIDEFIGTRLREAGLQFSPAADLTSVIRRLHFDLTGLPPTPADIDAVLHDGEPHPVERLVDRLLQSPEFGVHWGRHWLDVARYADSNGGDFNATFHNAWRYRDYVINAMNSDKPFNQFVREQIAGDLLPYDSPEQRAEQLIATGFLMVGTKMLSERDKDKLRMDVVDEQINTVGKAFMGLTLGCARCHDHKFDPVPTRDYYALAGIFRSTRTLEGESQEYVSTWKRTDLPVDADRVAAMKKFTEEEKRLESAVTETRQKLKAAKRKAKASGSTDGSLTIDDADAEIVGNWKASKLSPNFIGTGYLHDDRKAKGEKTVTFPFSVPATATYEVRLSYTPGNTRAENVPITIQHSSGSATLTLDQRPGPPIDGMFAAVGQFEFTAGQPGSVTVATTGTTGFVIADAVQLIPVRVRPSTTQSEDSNAQRLLIRAQRDVDEHTSQLQALEQLLKTLRADAPAELPQALAAAEHATVEDCAICIRGEHDNRGEVVPRGFLKVVWPSPQTLPKNQSGRLELANWISSGHHPLTARVIVNRIWYHLLGEGLVRSVDNFGQLGERPTHPELLDSLARRFASDEADAADGLGWSIKRLVREIVLSETYQQSCAYVHSAWTADPENRLLWRAHTRRLPAEAIRDAMLAISGSLEHGPGGSPVEGLGTLVKTNDANAEDFQLTESSRRSLYLSVIRNELPPMLTVFDFANPDLVVGKRPVTNVPAQALLMLNSSFVMDAAQKTAARLYTSDKQPVDALVHDTYRLVLGRKPTEAETLRAVRFLAGSVHHDNVPVPTITRLAGFIHVLFASTEFRMLN